MLSLQPDVKMALFRKIAFSTGPQKWVVSQNATFAASLNYPSRSSRHGTAHKDPRWISRMRG